MNTHINFSSGYRPSLTTLFQRPPHQAGKAPGSAPGGPTSTDRFRFHRNLVSRLLAWLPFSFKITIVGVIFVVVLDDSFDNQKAPKPEVKLSNCWQSFYCANFYSSKNMTKKKHRAQNVAKCTRAAL